MFHDLNKLVKIVKLERYNIRLPHIKTVAVCQYRASDGQHA